MGIGAQDVAVLLLNGLGPQAREETGHIMFTYNKLAAIQSSTALISATGSPLWPTAAGNGLYSGVPSDLRSCEHSNKRKTMARNICQSAEYFLQD